MEVMNATVFCDSCKKEFSLSSVNIDTATVKVGKDELTLDYFTCPKCNKIYRVLLRDERYNELVADLEKTKMRIRKNNGSRNEEFARVLNSMVNKKHNRLKKYVETLHAKYSGTFTFVTSENNNEEKIIKYLP